MNIVPISVGPFEVNCFLVWKDGPEAIVIDPGYDPDLIEAAIREHALTPSVYALTHGHMDHISALAALHRIWPAPVALHSADWGWAFSEANQMPPFYPVPDRPAADERLLKDGTTGTDAGLSYRVIHTPGHTPGSACFYFPDDAILFTGDTLFAGSVGRTDLDGGDPRQLQDSLHALATLPDSTCIYPGHGPASNMTREKQTNYFMQGQ